MQTTSNATNKQMYYLNVKEGFVRFHIDEAANNFIYILGHTSNMRCATAIWATPAEAIGLAKRLIRTLGCSKANYFALVNPAVIKATEKEIA